MFPIHSLQTVDVSRFPLIKDLLQFAPYKRPPPVGDHQLFVFWVVTYGWFDCIYQPQKWKYKLKVMLQIKDNSRRQFWAQTVLQHCFKWLQHCVLTLQCFVALKIAICRSVYVSNRQFSRWRHLTTTTRIHFVFAFLFKFVNPAED